MGTDAGKDFFISYTSADKKWAEWIAWQLEEAQYSTILQAWDFRPGSNFVAEMDRAAQTTERTILVLSPSYFQSDYTFAEWAARFRRDPKGTYGLLLPIRIQPCDVEGLLGPIVYIDLVGYDEQAAREQLLAGVPRGRVKPVSVLFPVSQQRGTEHPAFPAPLVTIWNIPYPRNPVFTGRQEILTRLADALKAGQQAALSQPQAISGLGGIGKTQIAVEYAYRFHQEYQAVLWARADSQEALTSSYVAIAGLLTLPERDAQDQAITVQAVKRWLQTHSKWLLILDNADELALVPEFLPPALGGHLLLTTRAQAMGRLANRIEVETFPPEQGALFLLRRASLLTPDAPLKQALPREQELALQMTQELGGLPLALDQAGAYLEETGYGLSEYQQIYQQHRVELLKERRGLVADHPEPVATTWSLSFARVEQKNPAAAELLRLCAYLSPDAIAEEIITQGAPFLGPLLAPVAADTFLLGQAIETLRAYSLMGRDPSARTLSLHRLVQAVLRDALPAATGKQWEQRAVQAINKTFPDVDFARWAACERYLPHALICATWIEQGQMALPEAVRLLDQAGFYLTKRAQYAKAEPLLLRALDICEQRFGQEHPNTAHSLNRLGYLFEEQGKYEEAERLYQRALAVRERQLGHDHLDTAQSLNDLGWLYRIQGRYGTAERLFRRALAIRERQLGEHRDTAQSLNDLGCLSEEQGKYEEAERLYQRALAIREQQLGHDHPDTATSLWDLGWVYRRLEEYEKAEQFYQRALVIREQHLGHDHPATATSLNDLGWIYRQQGKYGEAQRVCQHALAIREQLLGTQHPDTAMSLNDLGCLAEKQGKYEEAERLYQRALAIREQQLGLKHPDTAASLNSLAHLYMDQGKYTEAELAYRRALAIHEQLIEAQHPDMALILENLADLYVNQGKYEQAESLYQKALAIWEQQLGTGHPHTLAVQESYNALIRDMQQKGKGRH